MDADMFFPRGKVELRDIPYNTTFLEKRGLGPKKLHAAAIIDRIESGDVLHSEEVRDAFVDDALDHMEKHRLCELQMVKARSTEGNYDKFLEGVELTKNIGFKEVHDLAQRKLTENIRHNASTPLVTTQRLHDPRPTLDVLSTVEFRKEPAQVTRDIYLKDNVRWEVELLPDALVDEILNMGEIERGLKDHIPVEVESERKYLKTNANVKLDPSIKGQVRINEESERVYRKINPAVTRENPLVYRQKLNDQAAFYAPQRPATTLATSRAYKRIDPKTLLYPDPEVMKARITTAEIFRDL